MDDDFLIGLVKSRNYAACSAKYGDLFLALLSYFIGESSLMVS
jgi:hypothetical protein